MFNRLLATCSDLKHSLPALTSQCAVCRSWPAHQVCDPCIARFSPPLQRCTACAIALPPGLLDRPDEPHRLCTDCTRHPPPLDATLAALTYSYPWSDLITRYKFGERPGWASFFARLLLQRPGTRQALDGLQKADLIIPMPLSTERLQSRGFNQAWELATAIVAQTNCQATPDARLLLRVKNTRPQTELSREARLANVRGAFQVDPLRAHLLSGRRVVLVDDVVTSGASLFTAASVLRAAGAKHITGMTIARTQ